MLKTLKSSLFRCCMAFIVFAALNALAAVTAFAQSEGGTVSGVVTDEQGPVIGATVMIKESNVGVVTGLDGSYTLTGLKQDDIIEVSYLGYETQDIAYTGQTVQNVFMKVATELLDEVVVTALGIKREEKTLSYNIRK